MRTLVAPQRLQVHTVFCWSSFHSLCHWCLRTRQMSRGATVTTFLREMKLLARNLAVNGVKGTGPRLTWRPHRSASPRQSVTNAMRCRMGPLGGSRRSHPPATTASRWIHRPHVRLSGQVGPRRVAPVKATASHTSKGCSGSVVSTRHLCLPRRQRTFIMAPSSEPSGSSPRRSESIAKRQGRETRVETLLDGNRP
jgi:hypothetical protein